MAMTASGRGMAIYNAIAAQPNFSMLSNAEKTALQTQLIAIWGTGDLSYITTNAEADPGTFAAPTGIPVATTGSASAQTGATTSTGPLIGKGTIA